MAARIVKRKSPPKPEPVEIEEKDQIITPPSLWRRLFPALFFMGVLAAMVFAFQGSDAPEKVRPTPKAPASSPKKATPPQKTAAQKEIESFKARYEELKKTFTELDADDVDRDDLLDLSQNFYVLYEDAQYWPNGPAALYRSAEVMEFSAKHMDEEADYAIAVSLYEKIVKEFPESILADDALYAAARVHGLHLDKPKKALLALAHLQASYPQGDAMGKAKALEKKLLPPPKPVEPMVPPQKKAPEKKSVLPSKAPIKSENADLAKKKPTISLSQQTQKPKAKSEKNDGPKERAAPELVYKPILMPASLFMSQAVHMLADLQQEPRPLVVDKVPDKVQPQQKLVSTSEKKSAPAPVQKNVPVPPKAVEKSKVPPAVSTPKTLSKLVSTPKSAAPATKSASSSSTFSKKEQVKKVEGKAKDSKKEPIVVQPSLWERATQSILAFWHSTPEAHNVEKSAPKTQKNEKGKQDEAQNTVQAKVEPKLKPQSEPESVQKTGQKGEQKTAATTGPKLQAEQKKAKPSQPVPKPAPLPVPKVKVNVPMPTTSKAEVKKPSTTQSKEPSSLSQTSSVASKKAPLYTATKAQEKTSAAAVFPPASSPKTVNKPVQRQENKTQTALRAEKMSSPKTPVVKTVEKTLEKPTDNSTDTPAAKSATKQKVEAKPDDKKNVASVKPKSILPVPSPSKAPPVPAVDPLALTQELSEAELNTRMRNAPKGDLAAQLGLSVRTVYIDIGHGGKDQGTAHNGLVESTVVLDIGKKVGNLLKSEGFTVVYSRTSNVFIPLSARSLSANEKGADLFVSIHMNAFVGPPAVQGFETYYLDFTRNAEASRVATLENAMSDRSLGDLQNLLAKMLLNVRTEESQGLAKAIQKNTIGTLRAKGFSTRDGGTRSAPFHVLIGTSMPAVLVEVGYCTSKVEAAWLKRNDYRNLLAKGIVQGIIAYKKQLEKERDAHFTLTKKLASGK